MRKSTCLVVLLWLMSAISMVAQKNDSAWTFRDVTWGMTTKQVKSAEAGKSTFKGQEPDSTYPLLSSLNFSAKLAGIPAVIEYRFFRDTLLGVWVEFSKNYWATPIKGVEDFYTVMQALTMKSHSPNSYYAQTKSDYDWVTDTTEALKMGGRTYAAQWNFGDGTNVHLYFYREGDEDDLNRSKVLTLWIGMTNDKDSIHSRIDQYITGLIEERERAKLEESRKTAEKNAKDF